MPQYQVKVLLAYSLIVDCLADSEAEARQIVEDEMLLFEPSKHQPDFDHVMDSNTWITWSK